MEFDFSYLYYSSDFKGLLPDDWLVIAFTTVDYFVKEDINRGRGYLSHGIFYE